jgi:ureidoglycolate amidohydrolase
MTPTVDADRLARELAELAAFSTQPAPAVTRVVFSDVDLQARAYVTRLCLEAGLAARVDPVGNLFARWSGTDPAAAPLATASHIDAIPNAGRFDGTVGVLGGLAAIRALQVAGVRPRRSIDLILFTSEEPTRFGLGCLGSRLLSGSLAPADAARLTDADGASLETVRAAAGFDGALADVRLGEGAYAAFVELHIEQGPLLDRHGEDIGLVDAIAAPASLRVSVDGEGGHAGAVLMADRRDAFTAAAEVALAVEAAARGSGSTDTVGTVGVCQVFPGAVNSVPSHTRLEIDIRDIDLARRDRVIGQVTTACAAIAERRGVRIDVAPINTDPPATCAPAIVEAAAAAGARRGLVSRRMISRAYHDALFMARIAPTGMIFIPCRDGVSHRPDEYASIEAIARGTAVLADVLAHLAG